MPRVFVFGSINMDMSIACARIPRAGETVQGDGFLLNAGGKGGNQAVAAARMGAAVEMIGAVGNDLFGSRLKALLADAGVGTSQVRLLDDVPTGVAAITRVDGDNRIILGAGANHALGHADVSASLDALGAAPGDILLTQLEADNDAVFAVIADARARGLYTALNPAPARHLPEDLWGAVDFVCLNETECEAISGVMPHDPATERAALEALAARGPRVVAITLGGRGSRVLADGRFLEATPPAHEVADTACAGDTYIGAFIAALANGSSVDDALGLATAASALATTVLGAQQSIPAYADARALIAGMR